jgi:PIF1-like helicase
LLLHTASVVLTYYDVAQGVDVQVYTDQNGESRRRSMRHDFIQEKAKIRALARLPPGQSLRMFLDGAGGSGKSHVVDQVLKYASQYAFRLNSTFDMRTIIVTAISGVAATNIGGETTSSACCLNRDVSDEDTSSWNNARLLIVDEVSFMSVSEVETLDIKLRSLMKNGNALFGGVHILFCGDFLQLEPCCGKSLYSPDARHKKWVNSINCYVELQGLHRFKDDPAWGEILGRIRQGSHTPHDIDAINECVIQKSSSDTPPPGLPDDVAYCVYKNADRTALNNGIFSKVLKAHWSTSRDMPGHILAIRGDNIKWAYNSRKPVPAKQEGAKYIYENCPDHKVKLKGGDKKRRPGHSVDPLLKLYYHIPLMLVSNEDVPNGHANGTRVLLEAVVLNEGSILETASFDGYKCHVVGASSVKHLVCSLAGNPSKMFIIQAKKLNCKVRATIPRNEINDIPLKVSVNFAMTITQFPVLVNCATTGHKLQGQTKDTLFIMVWSAVRNWNYVALSRVRTRKGLYLFSPLPANTSFAIHDDLQTMYATLRVQSPLPACYPNNPDTSFTVELELASLQQRQALRTPAPLQ